MSELTVATDGIRKYGSTSTEAAGRIAQAAAVDLGANIAAVAPAVGPVGIEFLEAFARAQATHTKDVAALATFYAGKRRDGRCSRAGLRHHRSCNRNRSDRCGRIDGRDRVSTEDDSTTVIEFLHGGAPAPVLPNNVVESMLAGIPVPALPGIEDLFAPLIELGKSLGTGTFAGIDPVGIFDQASTLIDHAMGLSRSAVADVGQTWNSTGSDAATELSAIRPEQRRRIERTRNRDIENCCRRRGIGAARQRESRGNRAVLRHHGCSCRAHRVDTTRTGDVACLGS